MATASLKHRFSSDQFLRMAEVGIFPPDARIELLDGEIVPMSPIGTSHAGIVNILTMLLCEALGRRWVVAVQNPINLGRMDMPQPDFCVAKWRNDRYGNNHPTPADIGLVIEVADSSLEFDTGVKRALYAASGIPEYWVVDLIHGTVEQSTLPGPSGYGITDIHGMLDSVTTTVINGLSLPVSALFPSEA